jgi:antitoxin FitA
MQARLIQIRHVPDRVHRILKARAAEEGKTLSDYLLQEVERIADRPTLASLAERIRTRAKPEATLDSAAAVRAEREARR